ncbi:hypothetical protein CHUAL_008036 [Chamberlinius hualienensis]
MKNVAIFICITISFEVALTFRSTTIVTTDLGPIKGLQLQTDHGRHFWAFRGIPYAKPPLKRLRFKPPQSVDLWDEVLDATEDGASCIQVDLFAVQSQTPTLIGDEDCLFLNIYTPKLSTDTLLPVMVFIHGGGYTSGNGSSTLYGPERLLDRDIILVTINYRLGIFGFISTGDEAAPGNYGLLDQVMALKWVQQYITKFGGDPSKVTIFGQSAGGASVSLHLVSPLSKGLFHAAIQMSGNALCDWAISDNPLPNAITLAESMQCPTQSSTDLIQCLQKRPALELLIKGTEMKSLFFPFIPVVDRTRGLNAFLPKSPNELLISGEINTVPVMSGFTSDEAIQLIFLFAPAIGGIQNMNSDVLTPMMLAFTPNFVTQDQSQIIEKIRNIYFKNVDESDWKQRLTALTKTIAGKLDKPTDDINLVLAKHGIRTYAYKISYRGKHTVIENSPEYYKIPEEVTANLNFVSHTDDLQYLFKSGYFNKTALNEKDQQMSDIFLDLWTTFATTTTPTIRTYKEFSWKPVMANKPSYLKIDLMPQNVEGYLSDHEIWENIHNAKNIKTEL